MDAHAATELKIFIDNDGNLYERMTKGILRNLMAKKARGQYKHDLAVKAFGYLAEAGAKKYVRDYGSGPWHKMFDVATRKRVSEELTKAFESASTRGEYYGLLPDKKLKSTTPSHARKKVGPYMPPSRGKGSFDARVNAALTSTNKPRSFVVRYHSTDGRPMLGGVMSSSSSPFSHREDAENFLAASIDNNASAGRSVSGEVVPSTLQARTGSSGSSHARKKAGPYNTSAKAQAARSARLKAKRLQPATLAEIERDDRLRAIEARRQANTAAQESISSTSSGISARDIWELAAFLRNVSDRQVQGIYEKEKRAGRDEYVEVARDEAVRRGIDLNDSGGHNDHARRKQLDREILQVVPSYRWRP